MEVEMKRFTTTAAVFGVSLLAVWAIFQLFATSQNQAKNGNASAELQPAQNEIMKAIGSNKAAPGTGVESKSVAPVFDSNGAIVSDPSGTLSNASGNSAIPVTGKEMNVAPVFDANGAVVSNPSGAMLNASSSNSNVAVAPLFDASGSVISNPSGLSLTGPDVRVAPVIDANGAVVSDPSGTILNASNP
jgi:hypothetical protein